MVVLLSLLSVGAFLLGASILLGAKGAVHEIEAFVVFVISAILFVGAAGVDAVNTLRKDLRGSTEKPDQSMGG